MMGTLLLLGDVLVVSYPAGADSPGYGSRFTDSTTGVFSFVVTLIIRIARLLMMLEGLGNHGQEGVWHGCWQ